MGHGDIRAALEAATPGPWHAWDRGIGSEVHQGQDGTHEGWPIDRPCSPLNDEFRETFRKSDAHLIANAPRWLADLLEQNQRYANRIANMGHGLQALIDEHVTPRAQRLEVIHQLAQGIADTCGDRWPHDSGCQGDGLHGCPLCQILALSREGS